MGVPDEKVYEVWDREGRSGRSVGGNTLEFRERLTLPEFMALMAIVQNHGRPHTSTDQAHIENFFGHLRREWPTSKQLRIQPSSMSN